MHSSNLPFGANAQIQSRLHHKSIISPGKTEMLCTLDELKGKILWLFPVLGKEATMAAGN